MSGVSLLVAILADLAGDESTITDSVKGRESSPGRPWWWCVRAGQELREKVCCVRKSHAPTSPTVEFVGQQFAIDREDVHGSWMGVQALSAAKARQPGSCCSPDGSWAFSGPTGASGTLRSCVRRWREKIRRKQPRPGGRRLLLCLLPARPPAAAHHRAPPLRGVQVWWPQVCPGSAIRRFARCVPSPSPAAHNAESTQ